MVLHQPKTLNYIYCTICSEGRTGNSWVKRWVSLGDYVAKFIFIKIVASVIDDCTISVQIAV